MGCVSQPWAGGAGFFLRRQLDVDHVSSQLRFGFTIKQTLPRKQDAFINV